MVTRLHPQDHVDTERVLAFADYLFASLIKDAGDTPGGGRVRELSRAQLVHAHRRFRARMLHLARSNAGDVRWAAQLLAAMASVVPRPARRAAFPFEEDRDE